MSKSVPALLNCLGILLLLLFVTLVGWLLAFVSFFLVCCFALFCGLFVVGVVVVDVVVVVVVDEVSTTAVISFELV